MHAGCSDDAYHHGLLQKSVVNLYGRDFLVFDADVFTRNYFGANGLQMSFRYATLNVLFCAQIDDLSSALVHRRIRILRREARRGWRVDRVALSVSAALLALETGGTSFFYSAGRCRAMIRVAVVNLQGRLGTSLLLYVGQPRPHVW